jgi:hypothetical protein
MFSPDAAHSLKDGRLHRPWRDLCQETAEFTEYTPLGFDSDGVPFQRNGPMLIEALI